MVGAWPVELQGTKSAVQECSDLVRLANRNVDVARTRDPLPGLREVVAGLSNDQAHAHFRRTRPVVYSLRDTTINLNSELRALVRLRDALHKTQAEVSRNLKVNSETQQMRQRRPAREKVGTITITITITITLTSFFVRHFVLWLGFLPCRLAIGCSSLFEHMLRCS